MDATAQEESLAGREQVSVTSVGEIRGVSGDEVARLWVEALAE